ncbi:MAG: DNA modification methylase [Minisyncoccia bacterium]
MKQNVTDTTLIWTTAKRKISQLVGHPKNPRTISEDGMRNLQESIERFNFVEIPAIDADNTILAGHQRLKAMQLIGRGEEEIDVRVPNRALTATEREEYLLRSNQNTGAWDTDLLKDFDMGLLLDVGFGDEELQSLFDDVDVIDDDFDVDKAIKETKVARVKPGEIWQMGEHKLLVGDSCDPEQVKRLIGTDLVDVVYQDPPYNIGLDYSKGISTSGKYEGSFTGKKDSKKDSAFAAFLDASIKASLSVARPNVHVFYWCDERYIWLLQTLYRQNGIDNKRVCLWIKNNFNMTPQVAFNKAYEPCAYGTRGKPYLNKSIANANEMLNKEIGSGNQVHDEILDMIDLWIERRDNAQDYEHPTQKPVTLNEKPLKRCSAPGHVVFSGFAGSGSDLIACEQLGRKWRGVEIDPIFATVCLDRWEAFTNESAKLL